MKRLVWAFAFALLSAALLAAQSTDRLTLDLYLEYETVSDPQISPDGSQIIYTRGWVDKQNDRRESSLWVMNADGSKNRFLVRGSSARWSPTGDRIVYTAQGEPRGTQIFVRYMDAEGAVSQITRVEKAPSGIAWSPDGTRDRLHDERRRQEHVADQDAARARRRPLGRNAAHRRAARLPPGRHRVRRRRLSAHLRGAGDGRHAAAADRRQLESQRRRVDARRQADPVRLDCASTTPSTSGASPTSTRSTSTPARSRS